VKRSDEWAPAAEQSIPCFFSKDQIANRTSFRSIDLSPAVYTCAHSQKWPFAKKDFLCMAEIPERQSLSKQTVEILRGSIIRGIWRDKLPSERTLCEKYQISRNTLRTALRQLQREKMIRAVHGSGNRILSLPGKTPRESRSRDVAVLLPESMEHLRPTQTLWIDELRALLSERGCRLHIFHGRQYFRANPGPALQRLTIQSPHRCWILALSNAAVQQWFSRSGVRCIVAGSVHAGLGLPYRDLDHRAMCRHAAGILLGLGHRRLGFLITKSQLAGDLESEEGFHEGVKRSPHAGAEVLVCRHDGTPTGIGNGLRRLMEQQAPPTAILVANAYHYLTVVSRLAQLGRRVPQEVSVISRDDDLFLSYVLPVPARYRTSAHVLARSLLRPVLDLLEKAEPVKREQRLMPEFIPGESMVPLAR
jgi:LacI family transcriptional regulator